MIDMVTDATFEEQVLKSDIPVLIDFYADWCAPCKAQGPALESVAEKISGKLKVLKLDVDENPNTAQQFGVMSIPTLILFKAGEVAARLVGLQNERSIMDAVDEVS